MNNEESYWREGDFGILIDSHGEEVEDEIAYLTYWDGIEDLRN